VDCLWLSNPVGASRFAGRPGTISESTPQGNKAASLNSVGKRRLDAHRRHNSQEEGGVVQGASLFVRGHRTSANGS
jgi:hypothetical protein